MAFCRGHVTVSTYRYVVVLGKWIEMVSWPIQVSKLFVLRNAQTPTRNNFFDSLENDAGILILRGKCATVAILVQEPASK